MRSYLHVLWLSQRVVRLHLLLCHIPSVPTQVKRVFIDSDSHVVLGIMNSCMVYRRQALNGICPLLGGHGGLVRQALGRSGISIGWNNNSLRSLALRLAIR